ncbi:hypothetical protein B0F90DRAFT_1291875 [Multifurca ochricompacta]|uniref:Uncharacterized protein n=1 Tax=Multifurca ochricompacta TaxID=376703 RepID=A0AAD4QH80_9AGAM|nr:hypothetical protein B0F90DRAFT_1291875 [Multifurca ochricompacta]
MDISLVPISEIDHDIYQIQSIIQSLPRSNPQFSILLHALGLARFNRYTSSDDNDDLDKSILYFTHAIFLPQPSAGHGRNILQVFLDLTDALLLRLENSKQPEDVEYLIQYLHYLRDQPLQIFDISPNQVTTSLVKALAIQVELQSGDLTNDIEEMAILCRELFLPSDILQNENLIKIAVASLVQAVTTIRFTVIRREEALYQLVECLREACIHLPNFPHVPLAFAHALAHRFHVTYQTRIMRKQQPSWTELSLPKRVPSHAETKL